MRWTVILWLATTSGCTWIDQEAFDEVRDGDGDGVSRDVDCDDGDDEVGLAGTWYADADGDGFGAALTTRAACDAPQGFVADGSDCDDDDGSVYPGAAEVCGGRDEDCDGLVDDLDPSLGGTLPLWVPDGDDDGFPAASTGTATVGACLAPAGYVPAPAGDDPVDCDDADSSAFPGGTELCDGADNDCDGRVDADVVPESAGSARFLIDSDDDGWPAHPSDGAAHFCADAIVAGRVAEPLWHDALAAASLDEEAGLDCRDGDATVHPTADDPFYDGIDSNCDGASDWDADGDGVNTTFAPDEEAGGDCDDADATVLPGATEDCTAVDRDCSGTPYDAPDTDPSVDSYVPDADGDGWPADDTEVLLCAAAATTGWMTAEAYSDQLIAHPGLVATLDCDDDDDARYPSADDRWYDGVDSDCDGWSDFDADRDGEDKVIGDNETGFRGTSDTPYRTEAWDFILAGGALFNHLDYSFVAGHEDGTFEYPATQPGGGNTGFRRQMKILSDFIHSFDFVNMQPDNSVIDAPDLGGGTARGQDSDAAPRSAALGRALPGAPGRSRRPSHAQRASVASLVGLSASALVAAHRCAVPGLLGGGQIVLERGDGGVGAGRGGPQLRAGEARECGWLHGRRRLACRRRTRRASGNARAGGGQCGQRRCQCLAGPGAADLPHRVCRPGRGGKLHPPGLRPPAAPASHRQGEFLRPPRRA